MSWKNDLKLLIDKAEQNDMVLYQRYTGLYFTPDELRQANKAGRFRWGVINWELVPRKRRLEDLKAMKQNEIEKLDKEILKLTK